MTKEIYTEVVGGKSIDSIEFTVFSPDQIARNSHVELCNDKVYTPFENGRTPVQNGSLDTRLGVSVNNADCLTCNLDLTKCVGHFGHIPLERPCFHSGFIKKILQICQCICKNCGHLLMKEEHKTKWMSKIEHLSSSALSFKATVKNIAAQAKKNKICEICKYKNGTVKKLGSIKLVHERPATSHNIKDEHGKKVKQTRAKNKEKIILNPDFVLELFKKIPCEDYLFLGFRKENKPANLILTQFPVPPACIRPSVALEARFGTNEDDLTAKLSDIIKENKSLRGECMSGYNINDMMNVWDSLQVLICMYMIGDVKNVPPSQMVQDSIRSLLHRLKGKHGRFRANLCGKRVDFSARTVISPDPNILINQVVIPVEMAKILTFPEVVNQYNIEKIRAAILNGPDIHPGANYIQSLGVAYKRSLAYYKPVEAIKNLKIGDIVERHITDGDIVVFNRQPSLHRISMMGHVVKVMPHRTFRMNECLCTPYNADFDGDEMNIHVPQTYESKAETWVLTGVNQNIRTPRNGDPLISSIQDFITGSYLLTSKNNFFSYDQFSSLSFSFLDESNAKIPFKCPIPAILKPFRLWTGKQVISSMINPQLNGDICINLRIPGKEYIGGEETCSNDSFVVFYNGLHLFGSIDKNSIGSGSKHTIFYAILKSFGPEKMSEIMSRLNKVSIHYLMMFGLSHSLDDVMGTPSLSSETDVVIEKGYRKCDVYAEWAKTGQLEVQPGLTMNETLENYVLHELSLIRDQSGKLCVEKLPRNCTPLIMTLCGSKGSSINVCQMIACLGQQAVGGKRVVEDCEGRTLPLFPKSVHTPDSRGFVRDSFMKGLNLAAFFFHTMGGREGLVDTAVKTAETGYMQRRLIKCLEDLSVQYDNTVRNCDRQVVQFKFGGDGIDPIEMETMNSPVDFHALLNHLDCVEQHRGPILTPGEIDYFLDIYINEKHPTSNDGFVSQIKSFVDSISRNNLVTSSTDLKASDCRKYRLTESLLSSFVDACMKKYSRAYIEPGTTVGSLCAQSICEPATQMTLKTFHFAGVASMNITQGVPRMREIINCVLNIATPVIHAPFENDRDLNFAVKVKNRIEKSTLEKICCHITLMVGTDQCYIEIEIDLIRIFLLGLEIDIQTVVKALKKTSKLKFDRNNIKTEGPSIIRLYQSTKVSESTYFEMKGLESQLKQVVIKGYPKIHRVIITKHDSEIADAIYSLIVEGTDLAKVMATRSVVSNKVRSNDILAVAKVLGVEAARQTLINELSLTFKNHSIDIDYRHFDILAELMCHTGQVLGMTRFGLSKMKDSVLNLASFEGTGDHLYDAAVHSIKDPVKGISESIIVGKPVPVGTGMFGLLHRPMHPYEKKEIEDTSLFETMYTP